MLALLDGDVLAFKAAHLAQDEIVWEEGEEPDIDVDIRKGHKILIQMLKSWTEHAGCMDYQIALSDPAPKASFRHQVHPHYKAQRTKAKPVALEDMKRFLLDTRDAQWFPGLEGDDLLGIWATDPDGPETVVVSTDKDMRTIPGRCFIVPHMSPIYYGKVEEITIKESRYNWMYQTLIGDIVDNYQGCPGIGPARARDILVTASKMWPVVLETFQDWFDRPKWRTKFVTGDPVDEALMSARCARILHYGEYENGTVHLWTPHGMAKETINVSTKRVPAPSSGAGDLSEGS